MHESHDLTQAECEALLRSGVVGRVALSSASGPHVIPVNYSIVDDAIILRTSPYSRLGTYGRESRLAFEIDQLDHEQHAGWSVVARGRAEFVTDTGQLDHIRAVCQPHSWAAGARELYLRLPWDELSGRRLGALDNPIAGLPGQGTR